jgi:hypothetical protein
MKRTWFDNRIKHSIRHKLNISKPLTLLATLVVTKTIGHHGRPIKWLYAITTSSSGPIDAYHKYLHELLP